jgi:hypothetical protein
MTSTGVNRWSRFEILSNQVPPHFYRAYSHLLPLPLTDPLSDVPHAVVDSARLIHFA